MGIALTTSAQTTFDEAVARTRLGLAENASGLGQRFVIVSFVGFVGLR